jgi:hypothetical protein
MADIKTNDTSPKTARLPRNEDSCGKFQSIKNVFILNSMPVRLAHHANQLVTISSIGEGTGYIPKNAKNHNVLCAFCAAARFLFFNQISNE